ncbi:hypothetical protein, partial [Halomonas sp. R1t4]|uniref:hypothetical protein n=1 Tax=Halomonas sp. R1t4 TaxID=1904453 RepID=UPI00209F2191
MTAPLKRSKQGINWQALCSAEQQRKTKHLARDFCAKINNQPFIEAPQTNNEKHSGRAASVYHRGG